jgi:hypothetical protein
MWRKEFDRQVENLLQKGYPGLVGVSPEEFAKRLEPLRKCIDVGLKLRSAASEGHLRGLHLDTQPAKAGFASGRPALQGRAERATFEKELEEGHIPFVIVLKSGWVASEKAMESVERNGKKGFSVMEAEDLKRFQPIESVTLPDGLAYLALDMDTGKETLNVTPDKALETLQEENRSPLTIEEGIALITHYPEVLKKNNCFSLPGSRCGDRRVAALWISEGRPKLGWCWAGNPHTWLGSASCKSRTA